MNARVIFIMLFVVSVSLIYLLNCSLSPRIININTNTSINEDSSYAVDTTPPTVVIVSPTNGQILYDANVTVTGTASDVGSGVKEVWLSLDGGSYGKVNGTTSWNTNLMALSYGTHTISVYAVDNSNNVSTTNSVTFYLFSGNIYVSESGNDTNSGLKETTPIRSLTRAMEIARSIDVRTNVVIKVTVGIYSNSDGLSNANTGFVIDRHNIEISGGWDTGFSSMVGKSEFDGNNSLYHIIKINNVTNVVLRNLVIRGGKANGTSPDDNGGGIYANKVYNLLIDNSVTISNNSANSYGGGIYLHYSSNSTISASISSNTADYGGGGGVYLEYSTSNTISASVYWNSAIWGGGVYLSSSTSNTISGSVYGNSAFYDGGGVYLTNSHNNIIISNSVYGNRASYGRGGGVYLEYSTNNTISASVYWNSAAWGGGVYLRSSTSNTISGSVYSNSASYGGGVYLRSSDYFTNIGWISNNTAGNTGGGVYTNVDHPNSYFGNVTNNSPNNFN